MYFIWHKKSGRGGPDLDGEIGLSLADAAGVASGAHAGNVAFPAGGTTPRDRGVVVGLGSAARREQGEGGGKEGEESLVGRFHDRWK